MSRAGSDTRPAILCMAHLPPPVNGVTIIGTQVVGSSLLQSVFNLRPLPIKGAASIADIGKLRPGKLMPIVSQAWQLFKQCLIDRPDLIYFTLTPNGKAFYRDLIYVAIMKLFRLNRMYHLHGKGITQATTSSLSKLLYTWAFSGSQVILLSTLLFDDAAPVLKRSQCYFLANGIADPLKGSPARETRSHSVPRVLFFSNLLVSKGIFVLLESLSILRQRGVPFQAVFAGVWESVAVAEAFALLVAERDLQDCVVVCGPRYGEDKFQTFTEADILAFPTYNDAYPLVVLEAMSHGLPVMSTYEGAIPEMVLNGETGLLVPKQNPLAFAEGLQELLGDEALRKKMGRAGRERFLGFFTQQSFVENLCEIFKASLQRAGHRSFGYISPEESEPVAP